MNTSRNTSERSRFAASSRRFFVSGEAFELWENPDLAFDSEPDDVDRYARRGRWDLVFNALVLRGT